MIPTSTKPFRALAKVSATALLVSFASASCSESDEADGAGAAGSPSSGGSGGTSGSGGTGGTIVGAGTGGIATGQSDPTLPDPCRGGYGLERDTFHVTPGLCVRAVAIGQGQLRQIAFTSNGDLIGVTVPGNIIRYRDSNEDGGFDGGEIVTLGTQGGENGNNAHVDEEAGFLYAGSSDGVARFAYTSDMNELGEREDVVVGQPMSGTHRFHTVHVYDGWLYVHSGSEDNAVAPMLPEYDTNRSLLKRFRLADFSPGTPFEWSSGEIVALGLRNMVGFKQNAQGRMYGVINGIDDLMYGGEDVHLDNPGDDIVRLEPGLEHGYPYCFTAAHIELANGMVAAGTQLVSATDPEAPDPDFENPHDDAWCAANSQPPVTFVMPHSAPLDIVFHDGKEGNLPREWRNGAFVALHGSWNTEPSVGHQVVYVPFDEDGRAPMPMANPEGTSYPFTVVFGGGTRAAPKDGIWGWGIQIPLLGEDPVRPVGVAISPIDGALYVSSDNASVLGGEGSAEDGALYRIGLDRSAGY
jgi:glucose/arabinose dehydrogenase